LSSSLYGAGAEYALHSLLILATQTEPISVSDLAGYQKIPERFLAKIFARLKKARLVKGREGIGGGFLLEKTAEEIRVLDVLQAVDPGRSLFACAEIRRNCALYEAEPPEWAVSGSCRIHAFLHEAEQRLFAFMATKTLADLVCEFRCKAPESFAVQTESWFQDRRGARRKGMQKLTATTN
jgi:Rrf2 family protein